jgi:hypothetical protein
MARWRGHHDGRGCVDGQHDIFTVCGLQRPRAGALDRAELRDPEQPESDEEPREDLVQWTSDGMRC